MIRRLIILLLIVGCVFGEDELKDRRVISFNMIASPRDLAIEDSDIYKWVNESDQINYDFSKRSISSEGIVSFSLLYIKPNSIGGYVNYGQRTGFDYSAKSNLTEQEAKEEFIFNNSEACCVSIGLPIINQLHLETGVTF